VGEFGTLHATDSGLKNVGRDNKERSEKTRWGRGIAWAQTVQGGRRWSLKISKMRGQLLDARFGTIVVRPPGQRIATEDQGEGPMKGMAERRAKFWNAITERKTIR